ncbi:MAG: glycosyltransferase family 39 protein [Thermoanaerobaculum sp.]|nr:glycosyltransferase family 39 protein [Thermoanaerobaculum sp.]MDW7967404.1 glycosyltransferase family 39 protein [Thermoanaerobaculum sp.]
MGSRVPWWLPAAITALLLRLWGAVGLRPWHDEYFTLWVAGLPWGELVEALRWDSGPPLPYALVKLLAGLGLPPLVAARGLSVLGGTAAVVVVGLAAQRLGLPSGASLAAWLVAVHPLPLMWSVEGRAYGIFYLLVAASVCLLVSPSSQGGRWWWLGVTLGLSLYTHALGLVWLTSLVVWALWSRRKAVLRATGLALLGLVPWLGVLLQQPPEAVAWMLTADEPVPRSARWLGVLRLLPPVAGWGYTLEAPIPPWPVQLVAGVATAWVLARARSWLWWLFGLPAGLVTVAWAAGLPVLFPGRTEAVVFPAFALLVSVGLASVPATFARSFVAAGLMASLWLAWSWHRAAPRPEERVARFLLQRAPEGVVVTTGWWWLGLRYHLPPSWEVEHIPAQALRHPGWFVPGKERPSVRELEELASKLGQALGQGRAVAVVLTKGLPETAAYGKLVQHLGLVRGFTVPAGELWWRGP